MAVSVEYISVACNQTPHSADWNSNGLLAYGAGNSIALAKVSQISVIYSWSL